MIDDIITRAAQRPATIALSEGADGRVAGAAAEAARRKIARIILVGDRAEIHAALAQEGAEETPDLVIDDPSASEFTAKLTKDFHELRARKGVTEEVAAKAVLDPLTYAAMLVRAGHADGTLSGAVRTTGDVVRTALQVIGMRTGARQVSSFFLMALDDNRTVVFSDAALIVDPDADTLAGIALASADSYAALVGETPRVAMLSFSTLGSGKHALVTKVSEATELARSARPDLAIDGEMQFDAAFVPEVAATKAPGSAVAGRANVFVFPGLEAANIGYKIAERIGGAKAIGPVLQGLAHPANDLSRGCSAEDVLNMIALTSLQAGEA